MTTRYELIRMLTLNEIADDYEESRHIAEGVLTVARRYGIPTEESEILEALINLVKLGWAVAYNLYEVPPRPLRGFPDVDHVSEFHYLITEPGRQALAEYANWPFDDSGDPAPGWILPPG